MVAFYIHQGLTFAPMTLDPSQWYAGYSFFALAVMVALMLYGFYISLAGQPLFRDELQGA